METISGAKVSRFSFGTMQFGGKADEETSGAMYGACRDAGINFFDTAFAYNDGRSEEILGRLAKDERADVFIATKAANQKTASAEVIHREFEESRKRLGMETVDLLYIHQPDPVTPIEESLTAIQDHVTNGAVR